MTAFSVFFSDGIDKNVGIGTLMIGLNWNYRKQKQLSLLA